MKDYKAKCLPIIDNFCIEGNVVSVERFGNGHINRTYLVTTDVRRYVLQRMNSFVFKDIKALMNNISYVTEYLYSIGVETQRVLKTKSGENFLKKDGYYRMYDFLDDTVAYQTVTDAELFQRCGAAFGAFQNHLARFDASVLTETIPDFHNTPKRFQDFIDALDADTRNRADNAIPEIEFFLSHKDTFSKVVDGLADGSIPLRVTHNDTKLNNILMDTRTNEARAIIDLDTVMPGSLLYDFGDSIRFGASTAAEDEQDLEKVHFDMGLYEAYVSGFCPEVKGSMTEREIELIPYSAYLITAECGMRFLTDYLCGDTYFPTDYEEHNLVRARTQIKLASEMEDNFDKMLEISNRYCK